MLAWHFRNKINFEKWLCLIEAYVLIKYFELFAIQKLNFQASKGVGLDPIDQL